MLKDFEVTFIGTELMPTPDDPEIAAEFLYHTDFFFADFELKRVHTDETFEWGQKTPKIIIPEPLGEVFFRYMQTYIFPHVSKEDYSRVHIDFLLRTMLVIMATDAQKDIIDKKLLGHLIDMTPGIMRHYPVYHAWHLEFLKTPVHPASKLVFEGFTSRKLNEDD